MPSFQKAGNQENGLVFLESRRILIWMHMALLTTPQLKAHLHPTHTCAALVGLCHLKLPSSAQLAGAQGQEAEGQESRFNI